MADVQVSCFIRLVADITYVKDGDFRVFEYRFWATGDDKELSTIHSGEGKDQGSNVYRVKTTIVQTSQKVDWNIEVRVRNKNTTVSSWATDDDTASPSDINVDLAGVMTGILNLPTADDTLELGDRTHRIKNINVMPGTTRGLTFLEASPGIGYLRLCTASAVMDDVAMVVELPMYAGTIPTATNAGSAGKWLKWATGGAATWETLPAAGPHDMESASHTVTGLTTTHVLAAVTSSTFAFRALTTADVPSTYTALTITTLTFTTLSSADADAPVATIGRSKIGNLAVADVAGFSHRDRHTSTDYALMQTAVGATGLNAAAGQELAIKQAGVTRMLFGASQALIQVSSGQTFEVVTAFKLTGTQTVQAAGKIDFITGGILDEANATIQNRSAIAHDIVDHDDVVEAADSANLVYLSEADNGGWRWGTEPTGLISGTTNQVAVAPATRRAIGGALTLSTPQDIHSGASPTFVGLTLTGALKNDGAFQGVYNAGYNATFFENSTSGDNRTLIIYGWDAGLSAKKNFYFTVGTDGGGYITAEKRLLFTAGAGYAKLISNNSYVLLSSGAGQAQYFDCGNLFNWRDKASVIRMSLNSANGVLMLTSLTASQIVESDASKQLISAAKNTAYNKAFAGTGSATTVSKSDHTHASPPGHDLSEHDDVVEAANQANLVYLSQASNGSWEWGTQLTGLVSATTPISVTGNRRVIGGTMSITHSTLEGYKHIPSGGASNNFLQWSALGTAIWSAVAWGELSGVPSTFTPTAHTLVSAYHTASGLTTGHFLKATGTGSFAFQAHGLTYGSVGAEQAFSKNTAFNLDFGDEVSTVCQGNDTRLSDARTPTSHNNTYHSETYYKSGDSPSFAGMTLTGLGADAAGGYYVIIESNVLKYRTAVQVRSDIGAEPTLTKGNLTVGNGLDISATRQVIGGTANITVDLYEMTTKGTPTTADYVIITDTAAGNATKKALAANMPVGDHPLSQHDDVSLGSAVATDVIMRTAESTWENESTGLISGSGAISVSGSRRVIGGTASVTHSTVSPYKHIPAGGAANNFLQWSAAGTAVWSTVTWAEVAGKPSTFPPSTHYHSGAHITSGSVGETVGGTGLTSYFTGDIIYGSGTNNLVKLAAEDAGMVLTLSDDVNPVPFWEAPLDSAEVVKPDFEVLKNFMQRREDDYVPHAGAVEQGWLRQSKKTGNWIMPLQYINACMAGSIVEQAERILELGVVIGDQVNKIKELETKVVALENLEARVAALEAA